MFNYYEKGFCVFISYIIIFIVFSSSILSLALSLAIISIKMNKYPERAPDDIYFTGLKSFNFKKFNQKPEYKESISNLGQTGPIQFNCYVGTCLYEYDPDFDFHSYINNFNFFNSTLKDLINENSSISKTNINKINFVRYNPYSYKKIIDYACSEDCAINRSKYCLSCPSKYYSKNGTCKYKIKDSYTKEKYCYASNMIFKWKGYLYSSQNLSISNKYSYILNAILPNESCPINQKLCGFLDDYGHKLCLPYYLDCPINRIIVNSTPSDGYNYNSTNISDLIFYYTNEAIDRKIVDAIYVDSDIEIKYKEGCEILDSYSLMELVKDNNNNIYINKNLINLTDKSYLKSCSPNPYQKIDLIKMRSLYKIYLNNKNINKYIIKPNESYSSSFIMLGIIVQAIFLIFLIGTLIGKLSERNRKNCCFWFQIHMKSIYNFVILFFLVFFSSSIITGYSGEYSRAIEKIKKNITDINIEFDDSYLSQLARINTAFFSLSIILIIIIISFFIAYCIVKQ